MSDDIDLGGLRLDAARVAPPPRTPRGARWLLGMLVALVVAVVTSFAAPLLWPGRVVRTERIEVVSDGAGPVPAGTGVATTEAVGWIEADPFPVIVRPLVTGRLEKLDVLEGAVVKAGETVLGSLVSAELEAARDRAVALLAERASELDLAGAQEAAARALLGQNGPARLQLAESRVAAAAVATRLAQAEELHREAVARSRSAVAAREAQTRLAEAGTSYPVALERARAEAAAADAAVAAALQSVRGLRVEVEAHEAAVSLCEELVREPVALRQALEVAQRQVAHAERRHAVARAELDIADRELGYAEIVAPVDGVVLRLEARPGDAVGPSGHGVVALYDPERLRARIDVPLDSLGELREGQPVEIHSDVLGDGVVRGVVQRLQHEADLLKNTLQVKVGLLDPPASLRPETLCRARFLEARSNRSENEVPDSVRTPVVGLFAVPRAALRDGAVFVFDPSAERARRIAVEQVGGDGDRTLVRGELSRTQRVILDAVTDGERVREGSR